MATQRIKDHGLALAMSSSRFLDLDSWMLSPNISFASV